jgi:flagellin
MERLSSGMRINRAGDDAAGLAISEKMRGQIRGLKQAQRNAQDGISLIQTAEGALNETHAILQRMRELAIQAGNDTNTAEDRAEIQKEINQLTSEVNRIGNTTEFNTQKLLNATAGKTTSAASAQAGVWDITVGTADITIDGVSFTYNDTSPDQGAGEWNNANALADLVNAHAELSEKYTASEDNGNLRLTQKAGYESATGPTSSATVTEVTAGQAAAAGYSEFVAQIGANENQTMTLEFTDMRAAALGITGTGSGFTATATVTDGTDNNAVENALDVSTSENAGNAATVIQKAIDTVSAERSKLGAYQNRLEHTISNLGTSAENMQAAESRIRDLDMAEEMMAFTKNNILQQAATAMLAQANMAPQSVLQLLG